jgi:hypothetical protein
MPSARFVASFACVVAFVSLQAQTPTLRIVVLEGEGAVNIIQQKTAVRPLVEVRDRNNVPVAGATVTFAISGGQPAAFAGGLQILTVTTNAAGQAAAGGLNALSSGAFQIQVQAAYQGEIATAAISQTNFATAAAAAQAGTTAAGGTGGSTSGAAGGAAGGGGGISGTTLAIVGAAVAGGAVAATQVAGSREEGGGAGGGGADATSFEAYRGSFSGPFVFTTVGTGGPISPSTCAFTRAMTGTMTIDLRTDRSGGRAYVEGSQTDLSVSGTQGCSLSTSPTTFTTPDTTATGGPSALAFSSFRPGPGQNTRVTFSGSYSGGTITGSLTIEITSQGTSGTTTLNGSGSTTVAVTLTR